MGKYQSGILGSFDGKIGTVIGSRWKGIDYMRSRGRKSSKPPTQAQQEVRLKFSLVTKFVHRFGKLLMRGFKPTPEMTGINIAFRQVTDNAITGVFPNYAIDYSKVRISAGEVPLPTLPVAAANGAGGIVFTWQDNSATNNFAKPDDNAVLVVYCAETGQAVYTSTGAVRTAETDTLDVTLFKTKTVQTWLSFVSEDGHEYATSIYTGEFLVS